MGDTVSRRSVFSLARKVWGAGATLEKGKCGPNLRRSGFRNRTCSEISHDRDCTGGRPVCKILVDHGWATETLAAGYDWDHAWQNARKIHGGYIDYELAGGDAPSIRKPGHGRKERA